ncbi:MAG: 4-hydroxy-3-methylbut-2-enyl diphosphate reductase [Streptosporangiales bacterium]|nr:4-hydroxy-3-methylbut-2-enyl diphosphate reductase [Streptosporangiales bacterium]
MSCATVRTGTGRSGVVSIRLARSIAHASLRGDADGPTGPPQLPVGWTYACVSRRPPPLRSSLGGRVVSAPTSNRCDAHFGGQLVTRRVLLAKPRGYCAGVDRAVVTVERALEKYGRPVYVRKQIVHNTHVVKTLEERGAIFVEEVDEVPEGELVVFSAHGVAPSVHAGAAQRELRTIDATCPLVTKVHNEAKRFAREDRQILLIGHEGHEEVEGTAGEAPDDVVLVDGPEQARTVEVRDPDNLVWLSQTTLSVDETNETVRALRERFPQLSDPPSDDICYATQNRQNAVKTIAEQCDLLLVVGSRNSSNSVRLVEVGLSYGARTAYLVDTADEIDEAWLDGIETVGVTSGASVPEILVDEVLGWLARHDFADVEQVDAPDESTLFALPRELRERRRQSAS